MFYIGIPEANIAHSHYAKKIINAQGIVTLQGNNHDHDSRCSLATHINRCSHRLMANPRRRARLPIGSAAGDSAEQRDTPGAA
jgi:hypothetical protein